MKNPLIFCLLALLTIACSSPAAEESASESPSNTDHIQNLYDAFGEGNIEAVLGGMDSTIVWNEAENFVYAGGNPYIGPQAVLAGVFAPVGNDFEYFNAVPKTIEELGEDGVLACGRYTGKLKSNGAVLDAQFAHVWRLKDGKIVSFQQYTDTKQAADVFAAEAASEEEADAGS